MKSTNQNSSNSQKRVTFIAAVVAFAIVMAYFFSQNVKRLQGVARTNLAGIMIVDSIVNDYEYYRFVNLTDVPSVILTYFTTDEMHETKPLDSVPVAAHASVTLEGKVPKVIQRMRITRHGSRKKYDVAAYVDANVLRETITLQ